MWITLHPRCTPQKKWLFPQCGRWPLQNEKSWNFNNIFIAFVQILPLETEDIWNVRWISLSIVYSSIFCRFAVWILLQSSENTISMQRRTQILPAMHRTSYGKCSDTLPTMLNASWICSFGEMHPNQENYQWIACPMWILQGWAEVGWIAFTSQQMQEKKQETEAVR